MKSVNNMFTLVLAGLCFCSQQTQTHAAALVPMVQGQHNPQHIHNEIDQIIAEQVKVFNEQMKASRTNQRDKNQAKREQEAAVALLKTIKEQLDKTLHKTPAHSYVDLKNAIKNLNPDKLITSIMYIRTILNNISPTSKKLIIDALSNSPFANYITLVK